MATVTRSEGEIPDSERAARSTQRAKANERHARPELPAEG